MFKGSITALVTPFADGKVDEVALRDLIEWQIEEGSTGLVPCGTTGESATLSHAEHKEVVEITIETANGRVPVIAGAGSNGTEEAIDFGPQHPSIHAEVFERDRGFKKHCIDAIAVDRCKTLIDQFLVLASW